MLIKSLTGLFALATCFGISQVVTDLLPSECEALCNVRITDLLDQGPAVTYDWSQAVHGACECTEVYGTQDDQSECVIVSACSGSIGFSFTGGPNIRPGGLVNGGPATWCQDGLWSQPLLTHSDPPPNWDGTSPYTKLLRGCGDSISTSFDWYQDNTPNDGVANCDVLLGTDTLTIACWVCGGLCESF